MEFFAAPEDNAAVDVKDTNKNAPDEEGDKLAVYYRFSFRFLQLESPQLVVSVLVQHMLPSQDD